jgi:hypothetical protein
MYVAGTVPRVWPCRAPPRGASGRVAKPRGRRSARGIFPRARAPRAQRPAPTVAWVARRVAHHRVRHERAHRTHMAGTVPRVWPCRAPPRGASSRAANRGINIRRRIISSRARARAPTPCPTVAWVARRVAHHRVCHERAHRMHVAGTVSRVWPRCAPQRGALGRAAKSGVAIHLRVISSRVRVVRQRAAPAAAWVTPRVAHRRVRQSTRIVRASQTPCHVYSRAMRPCAVRRVAPRNRGDKIRSRIVRVPCTSRAPTPCDHRRVGRTTCRAPPCVPQARAPYARRRHRATCMAAPCAAARCVGSRRENAGTKFARELFVSRACPVRPHAAPTAARVAPRVAHRRVRREHAHRTRAADTVSRVQPRRAPVRGVSCCAAKPRGQIRSRIVRVPRAPCADALRPPSRGSHHVSRAVMCAASTRIVRVSQASCHVYGRAVRRRAVRRVAPRNRGSKFTCGLFRPARAPRAPTTCAHCRVVRTTRRAPSCAPRARAPYAHGGHCAARVAVPCAAARCVGSRRETAGRNSLADHFVPRARPVRRRPAPIVAWFAPRVAHRRVRHERAHRTHTAGTVPRVWPCRAPPLGASGRAAKPRVEIHLRIISSRARAPCADDLRPLSRGSHHASRTAVCATSARTVCTWRALCRTCGRAVRRRAVRPVATRAAG